LAEQATEFMRERGIEHAAAEIPLALGISFTRIIQLVSPNPNGRRLHLGECDAR
jgi:hypothetical protein